LINTDEVFPPYRVIAPGNKSYTFPSHVIDEKGNMHLAFVYTTGTLQRSYYLFEDQQEWKRSEIRCEGMPSQDLSISSVALSPTGQFCALVTGPPAEDMIIACMENVR